MQIQRLFEIVYILLNKGSVTAGDLAHRLEVSPRTIYRDIETLCHSGIPIYTTKGKGGGIHLMDSFVLDKSLLSPLEQQEILGALSSLQATNYPYIQPILEKLRSLFGAQSLDWIQVDFSDWSDQKKDAFSSIQRAILQRNPLTFDYYSGQGEATHRRVHPLQLWFKQHTWYLRAFCLQRQALRLFRLSRMQHLQRLDETFDLPGDKSASIHREGRAARANACAATQADARPYMERTDNFSECFADSSPKPDTPSCIVELQLRIDGSEAYRVYDQFAPEQIHKTPEGDFLVHTWYPQGEWVYGMILSFGSHMEVLYPPEMRGEISRRLRKAYQQYL